MQSVWGVVILLAQAAAAHAPTPRPAPSPRTAHVYVPAGGWTVDSGEVRCSLARRLGDGNSPILMFSSYLGRDEPQFILLRDGTQPLPDLPSRLTVTLSPTNAQEEVRVRRIRNPASDAWRMEGLKEGYFDRFAEAESITFSREDHAYLRLTTPQAGRAVRVLRACNDGLLRSWGIDTAARDRLQRQPEKIDGMISDRDYPRAAMDGHETGASVAVMLVQADGHVGRCSIAVTSRSQALDTATCQLMTTRFRYRPALDEHGQPTSATVVQTVTWLMPD